MSVEEKEIWINPKGISIDIKDYCMCEDDFVPEKPFEKVKIKNIEGGVPRLDMLPLFQASAHYKTSEASKQLHGDKLNKAMFLYTYALEYNYFFHVCFNIAM